jgi:hypothetical protein
MARRSSSDDLGIPAGLQLYTPFPFAGLNLSSSRPAIRDAEFFAITNFVRVGDGFLRTLWDVGPSIYTATGGTTIITAFFYNIAATQYAVVFLSNGTAYQINTTTNAITTISAANGTFYNGGSLPGCIQWGSQYLLIGNNNTQNSYWVWDGAILYTAGGVSPIVTVTAGGSGYSSAPTVTAYGGEGSGATFQAVVQNGNVVAVNVLTPGTGYQPIDYVQLAFSGGGSDNSAIIQTTLGPRGIQAIIVTAGGTGYTSPPTVQIIGGGGSGATATAVLTGTTVTSVTVNSSGSGYTSTPTIIFSGGGGSGAEAYASVPQSGVASVYIVNGGSGYGETPTLTIVGGGGTGATATATVTNGVITAVTLTNAGNNNYTSPPSVVVQTAINQAAAATVNLMPYGISGTTLEAYQSRVWIANPYTPPTNSPSQNNGNKFQVSAPDSISDFATSDGGLIFVASDRFLRQQYIAMRQSNGYLYPIGDSSCSIISGVSTSGNPPTTTFSYQNTDPQIGTPWRDSCQDFGRTILFANQLGVYGLYGGSVTKVSQTLDALFSLAKFPPSAGALTPTSAVANIYGGKYYILLLTVLNQETLVQSNQMLVWDESEWFMANQSVNLKFICTQEINSNITAWGSDGVGLYPLFKTPSSTLPKYLTTKLYGGNQPFMAKQVFSILVQARNFQNFGYPVTVTIELNTDANTFPVGPTPFTFSVLDNYNLSWPMAMTGDTNAAGIYLGVTLTTTQADMVLSYLAITYTPGPFQVGSINLIVPGQY